MDGDLHKAHQTETQGLPRWIPKPPRFHQQELEIAQSQILIKCAYGNRFRTEYLIYFLNHYQVLLYDECEKLLECRLLKSDETVTSGETLVFNGYLVDIGDPEGDNKPESDFNDDKKHKNQSRFRTPSEDAKYSKVNEKENVACVRRPLSPSQKIIREFKKRELLKYGSPKISQENPEPSTKEWHVLYTTQVTQKAKKYHDGFLRLVLRGFSGAQVMLFDTNRKLLDSRFLKKDDVIKPGESISFDSYLIDIDEQTEDQGSCTPDSNVQGDRYTNVKRMKLNRQKTLENETHVIVEKSEWKVLYTTQLTQKSKKYHEGFLQIELCGSFGKQVNFCFFTHAIILSFTFSIRPVCISICPFLSFTSLFSISFYFKLNPWMSF
uniref:5'-3' DNA helicase ZGRF1-like N-terminal domain-containing protein n=1 Tax=Cajanus cajan TaxID=3821 RepID=A0A151RID4_CAJCA|nr:hypothetical protein KK1_036264 [Cajanus cajan]